MNLQSALSVSKVLEISAFMICAPRLKRIFNIDIERCDICGKKVKLIAYIEDPAVIKKILAHLKEQVPATIK
jgi:rRNA maturation endonuclease Nob1